MDFGSVEYMVAVPRNGGGGGARSLRLTLIGHDDEDVLMREGLAGLRRKRILRLSKEAEEQGCLLGYDDLSGLLLTSLATLKRDINLLEKRGCEVRLRGRKKNGNGRAA